jgi:pyruvate dehydrogenase E2 component (dihydrolipoamide acetyltransferase)
MYGVRQFAPLVNPPQAAILGVGMVRPVVALSIDGEVHQTHVMTLTVSADHRVTDGAEVARFLATLREEIEQCEVETEPIG